MIKQEDKEQEDFTDRLREWYPLMKSAMEARGLTPRLRLLLPHEDAGKWCGESRYRATYINFEIRELIDEPTNPNSPLLSGEAILSQAYGLYIPHTIREDPEEEISSVKIEQESLGDLVRTLADLADKSPRTIQNHLYQNASTEEINRLRKGAR